MVGALWPDWASTRLGVVCGANLTPHGAPCRIRSPHQSSGQWDVVRLTIRETNAKRFSRGSRRGDRRMRPPASPRGRGEEQRPWERVPLGPNRIGHVSSQWPPRCARHSVIVGSPPRASSGWATSNTGTIARNTGRRTAPASSRRGQQSAAGPRTSGMATTGVLGDPARRRRRPPMRRMTLEVLDTLPFQKRIVLRPDVDSVACWTPYGASRECRAVELICGPRGEPSRNGPPSHRTLDHHRGTLRLARAPPWAVPHRYALDPIAANPGRVANHVPPDLDRQGRDVGDRETGDAVGGR
jgi:hypothetical protein